MACDLLHKRRLQQTLCLRDTPRIQNSSAFWERAINDLLQEQVIPVQLWISVQAALTDTTAICLHFYVSVLQSLLRPMWLPDT